MIISAYITVGLIWLLSILIAYSRGWKKGFDESEDIWEPHGRELVNIWKSGYHALSKDYSELVNILQRKLNE